MTYFLRLSQSTHHTAALLAVLCCTTATAKVQSPIFPSEIAMGPKVSPEVLDSRA